MLKLQKEWSWISQGCKSIWKTDIYTCRTQTFREENSCMGILFFGIKSISEINNYKLLCYANSLCGRTKY